MRQIKRRISGHRTYYQSAASRPSTVRSSGMIPRFEVE